MIESEYFWHIVFALAVGTITIRFSIVALSARIKISERTKEIFSFIPVAILPALIAPNIFYHEGSVSWLMNKERVFVLIIATVLCYFSRSTAATIVFGLVSLYLLRLPFKV